MPSIATPSSRKSWPKRAKSSVRALMPLSSFSKPVVALSSAPARVGRHAGGLPEPTLHPRRHRHAGVALEHQAEEQRVVVVVEPDLSRRSRHRRPLKCERAQVGPVVGLGAVRGQEWVLGVVQTGVHVQHVAQRDALEAGIALAQFGQPGRDRQVEAGDAAVGDREVDERSQYRLGDRERGRRVVPMVSIEIALVDDLTALQHDEALRRVGGQPGFHVLAGQRRGEGPAHTRGVDRLRHLMRAGRGTDRALWEIELVVDVGVAERQRAPDVGWRIDHAGQPQRRQQRSGQDQGGAAQQVPGVGAVHGGLAKLDR